MSRIPQNRYPWVDFIKQHQPQPPAAPADLEARLMQAVETEMRVAKPRPIPLRPRRISFWAIPSAIAASLLVAFTGYRTFIVASSPSDEELTNLSAFMESSWDGTMESSSSNSDLALASDWLLGNEESWE